jgi:hypothetical protein
MTPRSRLVAVAVAAVLVALVAAIALLGPLRAPELVPWSSLDQRWGTYLSEREWGTPREAIGSNPWGMDYLTAVRAPYAHGEDGIAGLVDRDGTFHIGWAVWDERQVRVAERLFGWGNPSGEHGEEIVDRRTFGPNTPTSSFAELTLVYPNTDPQFRIRFREARVDDRSGVLAAVVDRDVEGTAAASPAAASPAADALPLHVVLKGWFHDDSLEVEVLEDGLLLRGPDSVVAIVGAEIDGRQVSDEKRAIDEHLRDGGLRGEGPGHIGALSDLVSVAPGDDATVRFAWAEAADAGDAESRARALLPALDRVIEERRAEAATIFAGEVSDHEPVYRQALMSLLWNQR